MIWKCLKYIKETSIVNWRHCFTVVVYGRMKRDRDLRNGDNSK